MKKLIGQRIRLTVYVPMDVYDGLTKERTKTRESESGIASSILECFVRESAKMAAGETAN